MRLKDEQSTQHMPPFCMPLQKSSVLIRMDDWKLQAYLLKESDIPLIKIKRWTSRFLHVSGQCVHKLHAFKFICQSMYAAGWQRRIR